MFESAGKAVFLSYASQDAEAAKRLSEALRAAGVEVWLDQEGGLDGGDAWDRKIREQIAACALFVPVISAATQARLEGYFRLEWKLAAQRTHTMADEKAFLLPVVIDTTRDADAKVPVEFKAVQWTRLFEGDATSHFIGRVRALLGGSEVEAGRPRPAQRGGGVASPAIQPVASRRAGRRIPAAAWVGAMGFVALVALALWQPWKPKATVIPSSPTAQSAADASAVGLAKADKSIAVLPFANLSDDKENTAFFADGMHEDILTHLANISELRVISRTSVLEYRGTTKKIPQIARELGVAYILEGSVRRAGNQIRLTGQLIRAASDEHLWAKSYDRELTPKEVFAIQASLATEIAAALQAAISPETKKLLETRPTESLAAYDLYLKARTIIRPGDANQKKREALLQSAVELDPKFAAAWAELAITYGYIFRDNDHTPARLARADAAAAQAKQLAPDAPTTFLASGYLAYLGHRDWPTAIAAFETIIRLQPNNAEALNGLGTIQKRQGRWAESLANYRQAEKLDPGSRGIAGDLASLLVTARRWDEAIAAWRRVMALESRDSLWVSVLLSQLAFSATGSTTEVENVLAGLPPPERESRPAISIRKWLARVRGDYPEWRRLDGLQPDAENDRSTGGRPGEAAITAALFLAANGDLAEARQRLGSLAAETRAKLELDPTNDRLWNRMARMEALLGRKAEALLAAKKAMELVPESIDTVSGPWHAKTLATVCAWTGDKDRALAELARLVRVPVGVRSVHDLRVDPAFAPLRGDPRFEALLNDPKNNAPLF